MSPATSEAAQRIAAGAGYGGATLYAGFTLAELDLILRIAVGAISFISIGVHLAFKIRSELRKK